MRMIIVFTLPASPCRADLLELGEFSNNPPPPPAAHLCNLLEI